MGLQDEKLAREVLSGVLVKVDWVEGIFFKL